MHTEETPTTPDSLGIITSTASLPEKNRDDNRIILFALQSAARHLLPKHRVGWCMRRVRADKKTVDVKRLPETKRLYYANLIRCDRLWACPVCSAAISEKRRKTLAEALQHAKYEISMFTYTIRHNRTMRASEVVKALSDGYRKFTSGRAYQALLKQSGIVGSLRALEVTWGENGYHPHLHVLILSRGGIKSEKDTLEVIWLARWKSMFAGTEYEPNEHGFGITADGDLAQYVAKISQDDTRHSWGIIEELTKQPAKEGRKNGKSPKALLWDYLKGDVQAGAVWTELIEALSGKKQLVPSSNFWKLLEVEAPPETNEEPPTTPESELLAQIELDTWRYICTNEIRGEVLIRLEKGEALSQAIFDAAEKKRENHPPTA